jgi:ribose transport system ATP-binding protein
MHPAAISISRLTVRYGPTTALDAVALEIGSGHVHALLGENGAGKSTIVKVLSGLVRPDAGTIDIFGRKVVRFGVRFANKLGIRTAFQEISLVRDLTVAQNFMLMEEPRNLLGMIRGRVLEDHVRDQLEQLDISSVNPRAEVRSLDLPSRQKIEIARAVSHKPRILLLMSRRRRCQQGCAMAWRSHPPPKLSGTTVVLISPACRGEGNLLGLTIFRNGRTVGAYAMAELTDAEIIQLMIGRSIGAPFPRSKVQARNQPWPVRPLSSRGLRPLPASRRLVLHSPRQVLRLWAGLDGMGQRELFMALFGVVQITAGEIEVAGRQARLRSPADAVRCGIGMLPEDRKLAALFLDLDARENVSLPSLPRFLRAGLIRFRLERHMVSRALDVVKVAKRALWSPVRNFSGGNQQKIAVAKWLLANTRVLLLYDPTRGIDVGTKTEIYHLIRRYSESGGAVLFYSTEIPELVNMCDQVMVIYRGRIVDSLAGEMLSESAIMNAAVGGQRITAAERRVSAH